MVSVSAWLRDNGIAWQGSDLQATALVADSRQVVPGSVFVALSGAQADGASFVTDAVSRGAVLVVAERPISAMVPVVVVADLKMRLGRLAASFYGHPSRTIQVVGVTGTNGKTTTTHLIEAILVTAGSEVGLIGTVRYRYKGQSFDAPNTTPEAVTLQRLLATMRDAAVRSVVMEVSSHGLAEGRVDGVHFDVAVFTNLSRDHLDYHQDMEAYFQAKARLFLDLLPRSGKPVQAIVNADDAYGERVAQMCTVPLWRVGQDHADFEIQDVLMHPAGFEALVHSPFGSHRIACRLPGRHNVYNAVQAFAAALALGIEPATAEQALANVSGVPGRLEHFERGGIHVYVDYAHSDDALANVLDALRGFARARIITVFGCGGDRDRGKRPRMGQAAAQRSDVVVITSDNPRTEDPGQIIRDIEPGVVAGGLRPFANGRGYWVEPDRRTAIRQAVREAKPGDIILVAGKGHEDYQIIGRTKIHFDDREEVRAALEALEVPS